MTPKSSNSKVLTYRTTIAKNPREFDSYMRQFLSFPERVWLERDSSFPYLNQMTPAIYGKEN